MFKKFVYFLFNFVIFRFFFEKVKYFKVYFGVVMFMVGVGEVVRKVFGKFGRGEGEIVC